jgi:pyrimidine operon attenuation protein / uracil phosphoribosyltransferase
MPEAQRVRVMDADDIARALARIAHEILERNRGQEVALVGVRSRGVPLAERLARLIRDFGGPTARTGSLDINLYRDDLSRIADHPVVHRTDVPFDVDGARIVLVDDVLFTGRTVRAALNALIDLGRPDWIQLVILVDRGHREVPIRADYVGKNLPTARGEQVEVRLAESEGQDEVVLVREGAAR